MKKSAKSAITRSHRPIPPDPRFEIVFEHGSANARSLTALGVDLRSFVARGGTAIADTYALAARAFLTGVERLEDLRAERLFALRAARTSTSPRRAPARLKLAPRPK